MHLLILFLSIFVLTSCQELSSVQMLSPGLPSSSNPLPEIHFKISDQQKTMMEKSRSLDAWFAVLHLEDESWQYSELRNQGHKVREDLKLSYKWRSRVGLSDEVKVNLSGQSRDVTLLRYALASFLFERAGFEMPNIKILNLFINDAWQGPYLQLELVNEEFLIKNQMPIGALFKAQYRAELTLKNDVKMSQAFAQKSLNPIESDLKSLKRLEELAQVLDKGIGLDTLELSKIFDLDNAVRYLAVSKLIQNNDGIRNNFYLYLNPLSKKFQFIPWDLDETFRGADIEKVYQNNFFEQLEANAVFRLRIKNKMNEIWDEKLILQELQQLVDSTEAYASAQEQYFLNPKDEYQKNLISIRDFVKNVTLKLSK